MMANDVAVALGAKIRAMVERSINELNRIMARALTFREYLSEIMSEKEQSTIANNTPRSNTLAGLSVLKRLNSLGVSRVV